MLNYDLPLSAEESAFAAQHHPLIYSYLNRYRLPEDEFYDIAVFGYLRAVRKYLARPELRLYQFSTIAFRAMSCDVYHSREYWNREMRRAEIESYQEDVHTSDLHDSVSAACENVISFEALARRLTPLQHRIATLRTEGYRDPEIAAICKLKLCDVKQAMELAKEKLYVSAEPATAAA